MTIMKFHKRPFKINEIKLEVSYKCPLACVHCSSDATPEHSDEIEKDKCLKIIDEAYNLGVKKISFSGGEPLLWDGIDEAISHASQKGLEVTLYSSGNIPEKYLKLKSIKKNGASKIIFSIFGASSESHEFITRHSGSFNNTLESIRISEKLGLKVEFHFVPLSFNYKELPQIINLSKSLNVNSVSILRFVPQGRGYLIREYALNRLQNFELKAMIEEARQDGVNVRTGSPFNFLLLNDQPECAAAIDRVIIGPDLRIYPCDAFKQLNAEEVVETIEHSHLNSWSLKECWEKSPFFEAVRKYLTTDFCNKCNVCHDLALCLSGCLAQKILLTKDFSKQSDPMCIKIN